MFSCDPSGPFSLKGLALESDGTIKLQVYADGLMPFAMRTTDFGYQSVVMKRPQSCPVDDGLSGGKLDGNYRLIRGSVYFSDGSIVDTADGMFMAEGTMIIDGNSWTQTVRVSFQGQSIEIQGSGKIVDFGYFIQITEPSTGLVYDIILVERGSKVITQVADFEGSEVDQWERVSSLPAAQESAVFSQAYTPAIGALGSLMSQLIQSTGLKPDLIDRGLSK